MNDFDCICGSECGECPVHPIEADEFQPTDGKHFFPKES